MAETRFDRSSWLTVLAVALLLLLDLAQLFYRMSLPSEGWTFPLELTASEQRFVFHSNITGTPSDLRAGDILQSVEGQSVGQMVGRAFTYRPMRPANWKVGQTAEYVVLRDGQRLALQVPLIRRRPIDWIREAGSYVLQNPSFFLQAPIGLFVFLRRPASRAAQVLVISGALNLSFGLSVPLAGQQSGPAEMFHRGAYWPAWFYNFLVFPFYIEPLLPILFLIFPLPKRLMRARPWLTLAIILGLPVLLIFVRFLTRLDQPLSLWRSTAQIGLTLIHPLSVVGAAAGLIHTLVTEQDPTRQAQARWLAAGVFVGIGLGGLLFFLPELGLLPRSPGLAILRELFSSLFPLSLAISILRYRLFDIDIIIKRTAIYGVLTAALLGVYLVSVVMLQGVARAVAGQESSLAIVVSTLTIAALFNPLRRRIQTVINRRFFRSQYDAAAALSSFAESVREEVDIEQMQTALLSAVQETMQPAHLSLWVRSESRDQK